MKTTEDFCKEIFGETRWQLEGTNAKRDIRAAMKAYAEQAIDRCAEVAKTKVDYAVVFGSDIKCPQGIIEVDEQSILKVKSELK